MYRSWIIVELAINQRFIGFKRQRWKLGSTKTGIPIQKNVIQGYGSNMVKLLSGKLSHDYRKSPCFKGKSILLMAIFKLANC